MVNGMVRSGIHQTVILPVYKNLVASHNYTHSLPPNFAVVWSGFFNFLGVLVSSGALAFGIVSLLPVELILQVGSVAGTMVANHSGLQWGTVRNLLMAWVLTLPVSIALAGGLYWLLRALLQ